MLKYQCKILEKMLESCLNLWTKNVWEPRIYLQLVTSYVVQLLGYSNTV